MTTWDQTSVDDARIVWASGASFVFVDNHIYIDPVSSSVPMDTQTWHIAGKRGDILQVGAPEGRTIRLTGQVAPTSGDDNEAREYLDSLHTYLKGDPTDRNRFRLYRTYDASDTDKIRYWYPCGLVSFNEVDPILIYGHHAEWLTFDATIFCANPEPISGASGPSDDVEIEGTHVLLGNLIIRNTDGEVVAFIERSTGNITIAGSITTQQGAGFAI